jgi:transposase
MPMNILNLPDFKAKRVGEADHDYHVYAEVSNASRRLHTA